MLSPFMFKKEKKEESIRVKIYSVKGNLSGKIYVHVDIPFKNLGVDFWGPILAGKSVPNSKVPWKKVDEKGKPIIKK